MRRSSDRVIGEDWLEKEEKVDVDGGGPRGIFAFWIERLLCEGGFLLRWRWRSALIGRLSVSGSGDFEDIQFNLIAFELAGNFLESRTRSGLPILKAMAYNIPPGHILFRPAAVHPSHPCSLQVVWQLISSMTTFDSTNPCTKSSL